MKVLHFIKTSDGARWGCEMVEQLVLKGVEVTVVLPSSNGRMIPLWQKTGAKLIFEYSELPIKKIWNFWKIRRKVKTIIEQENPDIIHAHFFSQIILLRSINTKIKRIFQVPGPLHLENRLFKFWDILSANNNDVWIASSKYIYDLYINAGVDSIRVGVSYYGNHLESYESDSESLRYKFNIDNGDYLVGNLSYFYPPKKYLFQKVGLKGHELFMDVIKSLKFKAVLFGAQIGEDQSYYDKLKTSGTKNIIFAGRVNPLEVSKAWNTMDICLHIPLSENCGGVVEPLLHNIPVVCCYTGGLGEVIINKLTGIIVSRDKKSIKEALEFAKSNPELMKTYTQNGKKLVLTMFDVKRTSDEIVKFYSCLDDLSKVSQFNPKEVNYEA